MRARGPEKVFPPVRRCIYCGTATGKLGKEHIIPFGIAGNLILPRASCHTCSGITGKVETAIQHRILGTVRIHGNFPTRNPKERPTNLPLVLVNQSGHVETVLVPVKLAPMNIIGLRLPPPEEVRSPDISSMADVWIKSVVPRSVREKMGDKKRLILKEVTNVDIYTMARFIAKIAHSYAVADFGLDGFKPLLLDLILRHTDRPFRYIGGDLQMAPAEPGVLHRISCDWMILNGREYLVSSIHLFVELGAPKYQIIVGER